MLQFITAAESLFVSVHRDNQHLQMMALSSATPLKLRVDVAGSLSSVPDSARQSPDGYSDVSHIIFAGLENQKPLTLRYGTLRYVSLRFVPFRSVPLRFVTLRLVTYRAGRPTSDLHHKDAPREDGYSSACWRRALGRAGPWTQHNVFSNRPSVRRHRRKGGQRASRRHGLVRPARR